MTPYLRVTSTTTIEDCEARRPKKGQLFLIMDDAWHPPWRSDDELVTTIVGDNSVTVVLWENRA